MMAKMLSAAAVLLMLALAPAMAEVGDVTPMATEPGLGLSQNGMFADYPEFAKPADGAGTVHSGAVVAGVGSGGMPLAVAIDAMKADDKQPNVLRLDFTGQGKFNDQQVVPFKLETDGALTFCAIPSTKAEVQRDGKTVPVWVSGHYQKRGARRFIRLEISTALGGDCAFGKKVLPVRLIDCNSNLSVTDQAGVNPVHDGGKFLSSGDTVAVDASGSGRFVGGVAKAYYGQPILVDGVWYDVKLSADGKKVAATPSDAQTGQLKIAHEQWSATLAGKKHILNLSGGAEPVAVPADEYEVLAYSETVPVPATMGATMQPAMPATFSCSNRGKRVVTVSVAPDKMVELVIGSPLKASVAVKVNKGVAQMDFKLVDAAGLPVDNFTDAKGRRPTPKVDVLNANGEIIHSGAFEYG
jgi:hypothetical protein